MSADYYVMRGFGGGEALMIAVLRSACRRAAQIVFAVTAMARKLNLAVTGHDIENRSQRDLITNRGCDLEKGFQTAQPLPPDRLHHLADS